MQTDTERKISYYNSKGWKTLSKVYKMYHPLCDCCMVDNKVTNVQDVHHIIYFDNQKINAKKYMLLTDEDNLLSLCKDCHAKIHKNFAALSDKQQQFIIDKELGIKNKYDRLCIPLDYSNMHHKMDHEDNYNDRLNKLLLDKSKGDCDKMSLFS